MTHTWERLVLVPTSRTVDAEPQLVHVALLDLLWVHGEQCGATKNALALPLQACRCLSAEEA